MPTGRTKKGRIKKGYHLSPCSGRVIKAKKKKSRSKQRRLF